MKDVLSVDEARMIEDVEPISVKTDELWGVPDYQPIDFRFWTDELERSRQAAYRKIDRSCNDELERDRARKVKENLSIAASGFEEFRKAIMQCTIAVQRLGELMCQEIMAGGL